MLLVGYSLWLSSFIFLQPSSLSSSSSTLLRLSQPEAVIGGTGAFSHSWAPLVGRCPVGFSRWCCRTWFLLPPYIFFLHNSVLYLLPKRHSPAALKKNIKTMAPMIPLSVCFAKRHWINKSTVRNISRVEDESGLFDLGLRRGSWEMTNDNNLQPSKTIFPLQWVWNSYCHSLWGQTVLSSSILLPAASTPYCLSTPPHPHTRCVASFGKERNRRWIQTH